MPDRLKALTNIPKAPGEQACALQALNPPKDHNIPQGLRLWLDAIDHVHVAACPHVDRSVTR